MNRDRLPPPFPEYVDRIDRIFLPWRDANPDGIALRDDAVEIAYRDLDRVVEQAATRLRAAGVRPGDRVLLVAENSAALAVCILAASRAGAWSATVNARLSPREIGDFLAHSGARLALYFGANSAEARAHGITRGATAETWPGLGELLVGPGNPDARPEPVEPDPARRVAVLVYTSGTTGAPKAVMLTHRNLLFIGANGRALRALTPADTVYGVLPLAHVYGLSSLLVATLGSGGTLHLAARFSPAALADALANGVTVLHGVPAMYAKLLDAATTGAVRLAAPRLRVAQSGGAPLSPSLKTAFEAAFGIMLHNGYGMTETAPSICQTRLEAPRADGAAGPPIPGIEIRLDGAEHGSDGVGELLVRGPNVMAGYYRAPDQTAAVLDADGWLRTGDLARLDPDGSVWIVGRRKELILRSGFNVYPAEVEEQLNAHPDVVQSAVVGRAVEGNEEVVAFVELRAGAALDADALRAWLGARLAPYKVPGEIVAVAALPTAPNGKVRKHELQRLAVERARS